MAATTNSTANIDTATKVAFLRQPASYPHYNPGHAFTVDVIQTHMSWVFLSEHFVYKLKKSVRFEFLDFSTLERRHHDCLEEVRLNQRLALGIYLGVVPLTIDAAGRLQLEGEGETVDWLVKMQRLPREYMLDQVIAARRVEAAEVRTFARLLAGFYRHAEAVSITPHDYRQRFEQNIDAYTNTLLKPAYGLSHNQITAIKRTLQQFLSDKAQLFDARVSTQRIVEAHGDLRPEHICLIDPPVIIDCLEFNRALRLLDPADELAFLAMECEKSGAPFIGQVVFETYRQLCHDDPAQSLLRFYKSLHALLRAKLSIQHLDDHDVGKHQKWIRRAHDYLGLARHYADTLDG
ncbi:MAG: hypothetical protein COC05_01245 [Gammaproteobacteria bacterium]|nr:MAG: hypothetical protein COC05_01245 [Gammaproteobacteria bacterium]